MTDAASVPAAAKPRIKKIATKEGGEVIAFRSLIERAICNPEVSAEKLDRMLQWLDEEDARVAAEAYAKAMTAAQTEMEPIRANCRNPAANNHRYPDYAALNAAVRPIYTKHGFSLSFTTGAAAQPDKVRVFCLVRLGRHTESHQLDMPIDSRGPQGAPVMTETHATGSCMTYSRRYLIEMVFDLAVTKDDDGNAAGQCKQATAAAAPARPSYDNPLGPGQGRPPTMVPSPSSKLKAEMAAVAAAARVLPPGYGMLG